VKEERKCWFRAGEVDKHKSAWHASGSCDALSLGRRPEGFLIKREALVG
jgi:hypothetical protein